MNLTDWRENVFWSIEVNAVLSQNLQSIGTVFKKLLQPKEKKINYHDVLQLFVRGGIEGITLSERLIRLCFGQAKMTVMHESYDSDKYFWMVLSEFYDFIGRVAEYKFQGTDIQEEPLYKRIEYILDALFSWIDAERSEVQHATVDVSDSDEDY